MLQRFVAQPAGGTTLSLFQQALACASFDSVDAAFAYATMSGLREVLPVIDSEGHLQTRWLAAIDWCRSEPPALLRLDEMPSSAVRIHDGVAVVARPGCVPRLSFHTKNWLLRGVDSIATIVSSGNLSRNGLTRGCENASLTLVSKPTPDEANAWSEMSKMCDWFDQLWSAATPYESVREGYEARYKAKLSNPVPTDDDAGNVVTDAHPPDEMTRLVQLRAAAHLWIEGGTLSKNLGPGKPGNQLDMSNMSRIFFGFQGVIVAPGSTLGPVRIRYGGHEVVGNMRFGNNHMDKLNLPTPGVVGPATYDASTLLFTRGVDGSGFFFNLEVTPGAVPNHLRTASVACGADYTMQVGGRRWGVF